ncbi:DNA adenine methylase [Defluviimonas sp. WL0050]|uniref:site-specific DNA-methyltransferase (adenine-specific) n=1 Tax=Albidovulum litorale TaxID=2984134 RepID=A0ABT2ZQ03_9RHOB|nr:DNA adenine methylase [Defluviimonas sp. WL0050]MCV2873229.1 DNA adenine methylase [Defluviimonas sp. WL0050]
MRLPHAIPYQGSKRKLAPIIAQYVPRSKTFYEPFCGSAAMTIYAAHKGLADRFVIADSLEPIVQLQEAIVERPDATAARYKEIWLGQTDGNTGYFNEVRDRYNAERDPVDLLYLICRCVKNAVRFNASGRFTQSVDKRRLGMRPEKMREAVLGVSSLLRGRTEFRVGDWLETTADATTQDFIYMDPPYLGTSVGPDKRYHQQMTQEPLIEGLASLNDRSIPFALSYDGMTGDKEYGPPLPDHLRMTRLLLHAGTSSQATLSGRKAETVESLYMSEGLAEPTPEIIRGPTQIALAI